MNVPWPHGRCIVCLAEGPLTVEHVVPDALGGILTSSFLCKDCNDRFGHGFESGARRDPAVRLAATALRAALPDIFKEIEDGQSYLVDVAEPALQVRTRRRGSLKATGKLPDGSILVPSEEAPKIVATMLARSGSSLTSIAGALASLAGAKHGQRVDLTPKLSAIEWGPATAQMDFRHSLRMSPLVPLKASYEFLALLTGQAVYDAGPLDQIRDLLQRQDEAGAQELVTFSMASEYGPFHGIFYEGNRPEAVVQVRLFGRLAYRVRFPNLAVNCHRCSVTMDLVGSTWTFHDMDERA